MAEEVPEVSVLCVGSDDFRSHFSAAWRHVQAGAVLRVTDLRSGRALGWVSRTPPPELEGRQDLLPGPETADMLGPEPPPGPPPWVVRQVPEAEAV